MRSSQQTSKPRPYSLVVIAAAVLIGLLLLNRELALWMSFLGLIFLFPCLVVLGLGWLAFDAWTARLPRPVILVPLLVYGAYLGAAAMTWFEFGRQVELTAAQNAAFDVPFDPTTEALHESSSRDGEGIVQALVEIAIVEHAFVDTYRLSGATGRAFLAPDDLCRIDSFTPYIRNRVDRPYSRPIGERCFLTVVAEPDRPVVRLYGVATGRQRQGMCRTQLTTVTATKAGHIPRTLTAGSAQLPGPVPFPFYGCGMTGCEFMWVGPTRTFGGTPVRGTRWQHHAMAEKLAKAWRLPTQNSNTSTPRTDTVVRSLVADEVAKAKRARLQN